MRDIIDRIKPMREQTLFCGLDHPELSIGSKGILFGSFDQASALGRWVFECRVDLGVAAEDRPSEEGHMLRVWDQRRIAILDRFDTHCDLEPIDEDAVNLLEFRPEAGAHVLMLTGKLAHAGLSRIMKALDPDEFTYEIRVLDKAVAAWFDTDFVGQNIGSLDGVDLILLPGRTTGDTDALSARLGIRVMRGPTCYSELPTFFEVAGIEVRPDGIVKPKIIMLGRPGSGKTEAAAMVASTYEIPHVSVNEMIRVGVEEGDETAITAMQYLGSEELVPHNVMAELVRSRILMPDMANGFVLDGYPRIERDIQWLADMGVKPDAVVYVECDADLAAERLSSQDRNFMLVGKRIGQFDAETLPVVEHYRSQPGFIEVSAADPEMASRLYTELETMFQRCLQPA